MPQNEAGKSKFCTHWWEKRILISFYILGSFQTLATTANVAIERKISSDDTCFEGAICKDCRLTLCKIYKRLRKCYLYYVYYVFRNV